MSTGHTLWREKIQGIAIGPNDEIVMADSDNKEVIILDEDLKLIRTIGQRSGDDNLKDPTGVAVKLNIIAVSEFDDHMVKIFSLQGNYLSKFGSFGNGDGQFNNPQGLCFNSKGLLYVVDRENCRVQVFRVNEFLFKFGSFGYDPGEFEQPCYIAVDSSDQVYVTDYRCEGGVSSVFSEDGHFVKRIDCKNPYAICIAPDDYMITDVVNDVLAVFSPTHELIIKFGTYSNKKGQPDNINGIAINNSGTIFVTEGNNARLQIIAPEEH